ncbi:MAG: P-loop NTPase fold protein [Cyanobacteria bacterium P01_H01_bin.21]
MCLDTRQFFQACNPTKTLNIGKPEDRPYYIDFSKVRGNSIIRRLKRSIFFADKPSCQLFSGYIGCGKSTELLCLKAELQQEGFHVVYFEATDDLDTTDVDITDILLAIARRVSESLERNNVHLQPRGFKKLLQDTANFLQISSLEAEVSLPSGAHLGINREGLKFSLPMGIASITAKAKNSPNLRSRMRQYLEPRTSKILEAINNELLQPATESLKQSGKKGLVVIVDNLDRIDPRVNESGFLQTEYLFIQRGGQLSQLNCHLVYTVPLVLLFSNQSETLKQRLGGGVDPKVLPMVPVKQRNGQPDWQGLALLQQMVLAKAFPGLSAKRRLEEIEQVFDSLETLNYLCYISGGHVRKLLALLHSCLQHDDPPISRKCITQVIREYQDSLLRTIEDEEWDMIMQVAKHKVLKGEQEYQTLLPSMFIFEYQDAKGSWYDVNPALSMTKEFRTRQQQLIT